MQTRLVIKQRIKGATACTKEGRHKKMMDGILTTKLNKPHFPQSFILKDYGFDQIKDVRIILICAPAGSGKSTAASYWLDHQPKLYFWYSLDEWDNDLMTFLSYLAEGLRQVDDKVGQQLHHLLKAHYNLSGESLIKTVVSLLHLVGPEYIIVLDDYHVIQNPEIHGFMESLISHLPNHAMLCLISREDPPLSLARLRLMNKVFELRRSNLQFSKGEVMDFFHVALKNRIREDQLHHLYERSEGWIAGLQLMSLSLNSTDYVDELIENVVSSSDYIMEYLLEEVFNKQSKEMQALLLKTSVAPYVTAELIAHLTHVTTEEAQDGLKELVQRNSFLVCIDSVKQIYRYHQLFRELLKQRLKRMSSEHYDDAHRLAAQWFELRGDYPEAIALYLEGNQFDAAVSLIEHLWTPMDMALSSSSWFELVKRLPNTYIDTSPVLCLGYGWALLDGGDVRTCQPWFDRAHELYTEWQEHKNTARIRIHDREAFDNIPVSLMSAQAFVAAVEGRYDLLNDYTETMRSLAQKHSYNREWVIESFLGMMHWGKGDLRDALSIMQALRTGERWKLSATIQSTFTWIVAELYIQLGALTKAKVILEEAIDTIHQENIAPVMMATYYLLLAVIESYRGNPNSAHSLLETSRSFGYRYEYMDWRYRYYLVLSRLYMQDQLLDRAADAIREGRQYTYLNPVPESVTLKTMQFWVDWKCKFDGFKKSFFLAEAVEALTASGSELPEYLQEQYWRILLLEAPLNQYGARMAKICEGLLSRAREQGRAIQVIEYLILSCRFEKSELACKKLIHEAEHLASKEGIRQPFIEFKDLLVQPVPFVEPLELSTNAKREIVNQRLSEPLTIRELELLDLIAKGYSNQDICDTLFIAMSTVKSYNNNLFRKFEVKRRTEAVAKARAIGLID